jgi:hypothetical protein
MHVTHPAAVDAIAGRSAVSARQAPFIGWPVGQAIATLIPRERKFGGRGSVDGLAGTSVRQTCGGQRSSLNTNLWTIHERLQRAHRDPHYALQACSKHSVLREALYPRYDEC